MKLVVANSIDGEVADSQMHSRKREDNVASAEVTVSAFERQETLCDYMDNQAKL